MELARGADSRLDQAVNKLKDEIKNSENVEARARAIVEKMAVVLQGSMLLRHGDPNVAQLYCASRVGGDWGHTFGTLPYSDHFKPVIERLAR